MWHENKGSLIHCSVDKFYVAVNDGFDLINQNILNTCHSAIPSILSIPSAGEDGPHFSSGEDPTMPTPLFPSPPIQAGLDGHILGMRFGSQEPQIAALLDFYIGRLCSKVWEMAQKGPRLAFSGSHGCPLRPSFFLRSIDNLAVRRPGDT